MKKLLLYTTLFSFVFAATCSNAMERISRFTRRGKTQETVPYAGYSTIKIFLASSGDQLSSIVVGPKTTIAEVKKDIMSAHGYPIQKQHLSALESHDIGGKTRNLTSKELPNHARVQNIMNSYNTDTFILEVR